MSIQKEELFNIDTVKEICFNAVQYAIQTGKIRKDDIDKYVDWERENGRATFLECEKRLKNFEKNIDELKKHHSQQEIIDMSLDIVNECKALKLVPFE